MGMITFALFTPDGISLGDIGIGATNYYILYRVSIEVIGGCAVPVAFGSGDSRDEAGSNRVGAGHQRWSGVNRFLVRTSGEEGRGEKEEEKERG